MIRDRAEYARDYRRKNRARVREIEGKYDRSAKRRAHRHGLSVDQYIAIHTAQGGLCALCPRPIELSGYHTHVDHDHNCCPGRESCGKCVRGMLCRICNTALGQLGDSPERLRAAANYLERKR